MTRLTSEPLLESVPAWSVDGRTLIYGLGHGWSDVWAHGLDGAPPRRLIAGQQIVPLRINPFLTTLSATPDGQSLIVTVEGEAKRGSDLWLASLATDGPIAPLLQQEFDQTQGVMSPDGRWLAYVSNESGANEVFVRPLSRTAGTTLVPGIATVVSRGGGRAPRWRADSRELFYHSPVGGIMVTGMSADGPSQPAELFRAQGALPHWGVSADGQRFLVAVPENLEGASPYHLVFNWQATRP